MLEKLKTMLNPFGSSQKRAEEILNNNAISGPYNSERVHFASLESQTPITDIVKSIKSGITDTLSGIKNIFKRTVGLGSDIITGAVAAPINICRWAIDQLALIPVITLTGINYVNENTFGRISRISQSVNHKIHNTLGLNTQEKR